MQVIVEWAQSYLNSNGIFESKMPKQSNFMKNIFYLFILLFAGFQSIAQNSKGTASVDGILIDTTTKKPIEFATIALIDFNNN